MKTMLARGLRGFGQACGLVLMLVLAMPAPAQEAATPEALRARFEQLRSGPPSPFGIPLYIRSSQTSDTLAGTIYSQIDVPFKAAREGLREPAQWCDILMLHPNVAACSVTDAAKPSLTVLLGSMEQAAQFSYGVVAASTDFLDVRLHTASGPLGTSDYRFRVQATALDAQRTLLSLAYSHGFGLRAKFAMQSYFATLGRGKSGFTVIDQTASGEPVHIDGLRGGMERNAMRYYLAIEAALNQRAAPPGQRLERSFRRWMTQIERYPQLDEEPGYVERKRGEIERYLAARPDPQQHASRHASPALDTGKEPGR